MSHLPVLRTSQTLEIVQKKEIAELFGFETRNKYMVYADGALVGYAAEQGKSGFAALARYFFGHFRTFEIHFFDVSRALVMRAVHPMRFFFQQLDVVAADGRPLGTIQQRFAFFSKRFDVVEPGGRRLLTVSSPFWRPWTFSFRAGTIERARIEKKWAGSLTEIFFDADRFRVLFPAADLSMDERSLVLAAAVFVDLQYFEKKAS